MGLDKGLDAFVVIPWRRAVPCRAVPERDVDPYSTGLADGSAAGGGERAMGTPPAECRFAHSAALMRLTQALVVV